MKNLIYLLGLGVLGFAVYKYVNKDESESIILNPPIDSNLMLQPQEFAVQTFPQDLRMDNVDQPWFTGGREFLGASESADFGSAKVASADTFTYSDDWSMLASRYDH